MVRLSYFKRVCSIKQRSGRIVSTAIGSFSSRGRTLREGEQSAAGGRPGGGVQPVHVREDFVVEFRAEREAERGRGHPGRGPRGLGGGPQE